MDRSFLHLTVAAIVVHQQKFLFVEEIDKVSGRRVLNQPAGHVEANEDLNTAVCRELHEETGLILAPQGWLGLSQLLTAAQHRYVRVNFVFQPQPLPLAYQPLDPDILGLHWLTLDELLSHELPPRSPLVVDAIQRYQAGAMLPLSFIEDVVTLA